VFSDHNFTICGADMEAEEVIERGKRGDEPPVIDLRERSESVVEQIGHACRKWGFFQVVGHDVVSKVIREFDEAAAAWFALPVEEKRKIRRTEQNSRGWFDDELTKRAPDFKECFDFGGEGIFDVDGENQWPESDRMHFKKRSQRYYDEVEGLALKLAGFLALSLGLPENAFERDLLPKPTSFMRINKYPAASDRVKIVGEEWSGDAEPRPAQDGVLSVNKHTDAGFLTVLRQRVGDPCSLQVFLRSENRWARVHPINDAFIINVGDVCQVWSNDEFKSPIHRVLANRERERFSTPYFLNPRYDSILEKRTLSSDTPNYIPFTWGEFRRGRFQGDYSDTGKDDIQISDFRVPSSSKL